MEENFNEDELKNENLHPKAQYMNCTDNQDYKIKLVRFAFSEMYKCMDEVLGQSRESSLAYTKLEEAQMWAIKGITREGRIE